MTANPFFADWTTPFGLPPFEAITPDHISPAFEAGLEAHRKDIAAIASDVAPATFANTIEALERSGKLLRKVGRVFWNLSGADTNPALQAIEAAGERFAA